MDNLQRCTNIHSAELQKQVMVVSHQKEPTWRGHLPGACARACESSRGAGLGAERPSEEEAGWDQHHVQFHPLLDLLRALYLFYLFISVLFLKK